MASSGVLKALTTQSTLRSSIHPLRHGPCCRVTREGIKNIILTLFFSGGGCCGRLVGTCVCLRSPPLLGSLLRSWNVLGLQLAGRTLPCSGARQLLTEHPPPPEQCGGPEDLELKRWSLGSFISRTQQDPGLAF